MQLKLKGPYNGEYPKQKHPNLQNQINMHKHYVNDSLNIINCWYISTSTCLLHHLWRPCASLLTRLTGSTLITCSSWWLDGRTGIIIIVVVIISLYNMQKRICNQQGDNWTSRYTHNLHCSRRHLLVDDHDSQQYVLWRMSCDAR